MNNTLSKKNYAAIYVNKPEDVKKVEAIIEEMDPFEYDYLPEGLVKPFSEYPKTTYTHKFDALDMNALTALCWSRGIFIWVFDARSEYPENAIKKYAVNTEVDK